MWSMSSPFLLLTLAVGAVLSLTPYGYHSFFGYLSGEKPFLTLRNMPIEKCVTECQLRNACKAVNYWRQRRDCEMLLTDEGTLIQQQDSKHVSLFIKKRDVQSLASLPLTCQSCDDKTVCDIDSGDCVFKECRQLLVPNATIKGNILSVGSKIRIYCNEQFAQRPNETLSICQENGTWNNVPTCHYLNDSVCQPDTNPFQHDVLQDGTSIYYRAFLDAQTDFDGARAICEAACGSLYQILTPAKMDFTLKLMTSAGFQSKSVWINGVLNKTTNVWETIAGTPLPMSQDLWSPTAPNDNKNEPTCVWMGSMFSYKWDDIPCTGIASVPIYALCEVF